MKLKLKLNKSVKLFLIMLSGSLILSFWVLMDAFLIPQNYAKVMTPSDAERTVEPKVLTEVAYKDEDIAISISTVVEEEFTYHVVDIRLSDVRFLKSAFAKNIYGKNVVETTSEMAEEHQAILAFNGDFYGSRNSGLLIRNGDFFRDDARKAPNNRALLIDDSGDFQFVTEGVSDGESYVNKGIIHSLSYGPVLVEDGRVSEIDPRFGFTSSSRTAIGMIEPLHYLLIVVDQNGKQSKGMRLDTLAKLFVKLNAVSAYNLDGGSSSTLWFNGRIVNQPSHVGIFSDERSISDILYIGY